MYLSTYFILFTILWSQRYYAQEVYETDMNFRVEPGSRICFFEKGNAGQMMETKYQVIDGQHGDYDISFQIKDPNGEIILDDYKQPYNSLIVDLEVSGDYVFCLDNTHSVMNSKLVFVYVVIENKPQEDSEKEKVEVPKVDGAEEEVLEWKGISADGEPYYIPVADIADSMTRTLRRVVRARHLLNMYGALKSRDSYLAFEDTFIVDMWSSFQITCMFVVGMMQVYMIKKLFNRPSGIQYSSYW